MIPHILQEWMSYKKTVMPNDAGTTQISETRMAFYAGSQAAVGLINSGTPVADLDKELAEYLAQFKKMRGAP